MPEPEPTETEIAAAQMEMQHFLSTRLSVPLDVPVGRASALDVPGSASPPIDLGIWRVETFGSLIKLGQLIQKRELLLDQQLAITLFLYLVEQCGLTKIVDVPNENNEIVKDLPGKVTC